MESASPLRQSIQEAAELAFVEPEKLSASCGVGGTRWAMMVDQLESKGRWGNVKSFVCARAGITKAWRLIFLPERADQARLL
jgi:hypothetical protein